MPTFTVFTGRSHQSLMVEDRPSSSSLGSRGTLHCSCRWQPMTLGDMRANGVRSIKVYCWGCHNDAVLAVDTWPDHVPVPSFGPRMVCTSCVIIGADGPPELGGAAGATEPGRGAVALMAKRAAADMMAEELSVAERIMLFCVASGTDWRRAGVKSTTAQRMLIRGLIQWQAAGAYVLIKQLNLSPAFPTSTAPRRTSRSRAGTRDVVETYGVLPLMILLGFFCELGKKG